jgi:hypothetical protein
MRGLRSIVPAFLMLGATLAPFSAAAQDATPPAGEASPGPRAMLKPCNAEPRDVEQVVAIWFNPAGTPLATPQPAAPITDLEALPAGERPDEATVQAITETTLDWFSCLQFSGQPSRAFGFMTDHLLAQFGPDLSNPAQNTAEAIRAALEAQMAATPVPNEVVSPLVGPRRARVLDDGRVGAVWALRGNRFFLIYKQVDGKWLIDDAINVIEPAGTPVAATPTS